MVGIFFYASTFYPLQLWYNLQQEANSTFDFSQNTNEVVCVKLPLALPYSKEWNEPQETKGLIQLNGQFYNLLKKDFRNDTLYIYYTRNQNAREIFASLSTYIQEQVAKAASPQNNQSTHNQLVKLFKKDFFCTTNYLFTSPTLTTINQLISIFSKSENRYASRSLAVSLPPPRA